MNRIAICYADEDERHLTALEKLLAPAERKGQIDIWHRGKIPYGTNIQDQVKKGFEQADLIVLLLSADLLASWEEDVDLALQQQRARGAVVLPVLVRAALLDERFSKSRVFPRKDTPISTKKADADSEWVAVATEIQRRRLKLLFLGANPKDAKALDLEREVREIRDRITDQGGRDNLLLAREGEVALDRLSQILLRHQPTLLHFSGHGTKDGRLVLLDAQGGGALAQQEGLARLCAFFARSGLRCVVLNACYAEEQARLIAEHVECVVGISGEIKDASAIAFTAGFYTFLAAGKTVQEAFNLGKNEIDLSCLPHAGALRLHTKAGVDPTTLKLF